MFLLLSAVQTQADGLMLTDPQRALVAIGQAFAGGVLPFLPKLQQPPSDDRRGMD